MRLLPHFNIQYRNMFDVQRTHEKYMRLHLTSHPITYANSFLIGWHNKFFCVNHIRNARHRAHCRLDYYFYCNSHGWSQKYENHLHRVVRKRRKGTENVCWKLSKWIHRSSPLTMNAECPRSFVLDVQCSLFVLSYHIPCIFIFFQLKEKRVHNRKVSELNIEKLKMFTNRFFNCSLRSRIHIRIVFCLFWYPIG